MNQLTGTPKTPHINVHGIIINKSKVLVNLSSQRTSCSPVIRNILNAYSSASPLIMRLDNINPLGLNLSVSMKRKLILIMKALTLFQLQELLQKKQKSHGNADLWTMVT